jgi:excisionase family DNA binding protein
LNDPGRLVVGAAHALERARARGAPSIEPDDLFVGLLLATSRFGIVDLGSVAIDLERLGLQFELPTPDLSVKPRYSDAAVRVFDRAAKVARGDGASAVAPIHLLVVLGDPAIATFTRMAERYAIDSAAWRRILAAVLPSRETSVPEPMASTDERRRPALEQLLSPDDAAALLGVHIQTLRGYIRSGKLAAFRVAGERALRVRKTDLEGLLEHLDPRKELPPPIETFGGQALRGNDGGSVC